MNDKRKILEMLAAGQVTVDEALDLLAALEPTPSASPRPKGQAKMLRVLVDAEDEAKVRVNVPAQLAKFALNFIPKEQREQMEAQGIHLDELLDLLKGELPEGRLVDIEASDEGQPVRVVVEVV